MIHMLESVGEAFVYAFCFVLGGGFLLGQGVEWFLALKERWNSPQ